MNNYRQYGNELENYVAEKFKRIDKTARRSPSSGASGSKTDVINDICFVECKRRNTKDFTIKEEYWTKLCASIPHKSRKFPLYITENSKGHRLAVVDLEDFFRLLYEIYEEE